MTIRNTFDPTKFNPEATLPYSLRLADFERAMQDIYDFFYDVNTLLSSKGLHRFDDMMRAANMSGLISDMATASLARQSRALVENQYFNGHPDLLKRGQYANDSVLSGSEGIEIKSTIKVGGAVDTHGARDQWMCVFVYQLDTKTEPASQRRPMKFTEIYLAQVEKADFRENGRGTLGTRTATLHKDGLKKLHANWIYKDVPLKPARKRAAKKV